MTTCTTLEGGGSSIFPLPDDFEYEYRYLRSERVRLHLAQPQAVASQSGPLAHATSPPSPSPEPSITSTPRESPEPRQGAYAQQSPSNKQYLSLDKPVDVATPQTPPPSRSHPVAALSSATPSGTSGSLGNASAARGECVRVSSRRLSSRMGTEVVLPETSIELSATRESVSRPARMPQTQSSRAEVYHHSSFKTVYDACNRIADPTAKPFPGKVGQQYRFYKDISDPDPKGWGYWACVHCDHPNTNLNGPGSGEFRVPHQKPSNATVRATQHLYSKHSHLSFLFKYNITILK